jgi:hypothetical protein
MDAREMTYPEQSELLSQIRWTPIGKIQRDIHFIMNMVASYVYWDYETKQTNWKWDADFDEGETEETRQAEEMWRIRQEAIDHGLPPPKDWAK